MFVIYNNGLIQLWMPVKKMMEACREKTYILNSRKSEVAGCIVHTETDKGS